MASSIAGFEDLDLFNPPETYTTAARGYDAASPGWGRVIDRTLELLDPRPGQDVLDVGCGPGILPLRAAPLVGSGGSVTGLDVAEGMLEVAREKAAAQGLGDTLAFQLGDMHDLPFEDARFDGVSCSYAMFFAQDVTAVGRELWRVLKPGGRLAVATIGEQFFEPLWAQFRAETARLRPGLEIDMPWERRQVADGGTLCGLLAAGYVRIRLLEVEDVPVPLSGPDDWWRIAEGTGISRAIKEMGAEAAQTVRAANAAWMQQHDVASVTISTNFVLAEKLPAA